jgi:hypothetical protein
VPSDDAVRWASVALGKDCADVGLAALHVECEFLDRACVAVGDEVLDDRGGQSGGAVGEVFCVKGGHMQVDGPASGSFTADHTFLQFASVQRSASR